MHILDNTLELSSVLEYAYEQNASDIHLTAGKPVVLRIDGELVEVEAEWVEEYEVNDVEIADGFVIKTKELGYYVVSDVEAEIEAEAEVEAPVEADKANPETGAADFVGAAVAMAVVSVAAAGALALKK